jgi:prepilin-type N-terminal cleavage/methylation domain-containing protein
MKSRIINKILIFGGSADQAGFTLIELMTVIFIILFLSGMVFANYHAGNSQLSLELEANKIASDIRTVQEMGLSAPAVPGFADQVIGGYGIHFLKKDKSYVFFVDTSPAGGDGQYESGGDTILQTIAMDPTYYIISVDTDAVSALFLPPEPTTNITGKNGEILTQATITIASTNNPSLTKSVIVNKAGLVYVQ